MIFLLPLERQAVKTMSYKLRPILRNLRKSEVEVTVHGEDLKVEINGLSPFDEGTTRRWPD